VTDIFISIISIDVTSSTTSGTAPPSTPAPDLLLPRSVLPIHYDLMVEPQHDTNQFLGSIDIQLNVTEATNVIKIHSYLLSILNEKVFDPNGNELDIKSSTYDPQRQFQVIELQSQMTVRKGYQLHLNFNGSLVGKIIGFYKSEYTNSDNQVRYWFKSISMHIYDKNLRKKCFNHNPNHKFLIKKFVLSLITLKVLRYIALHIIFRPN